MKWMYRVQHQLKLALLLTVVVAVILGCSFVEKNYFTEMNNSVSSIYRDRLVPETELFQLNDLMHARRLLLEKYLLAPQPQQAAAVATQLAAHEAEMSRLLDAFSTSYLVAEERVMLQQFKERLRQYNQLEHASLAGAREPRPAAYAQELAPVFDGLHLELRQLSQLQTHEAKNLCHDSEVLKGSASLVSSLQIGMVVVVALAVHGLLLTSRTLVPKKLQDFRWN